MSSPEREKGATSAAPSRQWFSGVGLIEPIEQVPQDPLGHAPHHADRGHEGRRRSRRAGNFHLHCRLPLVAEVSKWKPGGRGDLGIEREVRSSHQAEDVGTNGDRGKRPGSRIHVVEHAEEGRPGQPDADLLGSLPDRRVDEIVVARLTSAAGERHVTRPGVAFAVGTPDDQYRVGLRREDQRNRCPEKAGLVGDDGKCRAQPAGEKAVRRQWECERQAPPQQLPVAGAAAGAGCPVPADAGRAVRDISRSTASLPQLQVTAAGPRTSRSKRLPHRAHS